MSDETKPKPKPKPKPKRLLKFLLFGVGLLGGLAIALVLAVMYVLSWPEFGGSFEGDRLARMESSPQYTTDRFDNDPLPPPEDYMVNLEEFLGDQVRKPPGRFPADKPRFTEDVSPGLRAYWLGHATVLVEIDGRRVITDPMLSEHPFPVTFLAPARHNPPPIAMDELPKIDVVTISHDHFDHLDMKTVQALANDGSHFFVGLGVGAHLEVWDVPNEQIHEMDWWETVEHVGLKVHCTPARHYSGRKAMDNSTLWASWVVEGSTHRVFHSGDTGYAPHFKEIRDKRGPIDLTFIKIGDYGNDAAWESIHMVPEDSIRAHQDLGAKTLLPIHWGTFELSFHDWDEPMKRAQKAAGDAKVHMVTPRLGQQFTFGEPFENEAWWEAL